MQEKDEYIDALIRLHSGLDRLGPGDADFSRDIIAQLPDLPPRPRIADLGCGTGAGSLILAHTFRCPVRAVDFVGEFLEQLRDRAARLGLSDYIETIQGDIGSLDWTPGSIDLLWSEGAAYNIGFANALECWRPLLARDGVAVISEMNYFSRAPAAAVSNYMQQIYPGIQHEADNAALIEKSGYRLLESRRLPSSAWWDNYYGPLRARIGAVRADADPLLAAVIDDTEAEMNLFQAHADDYGYSCFIMRAA